MEEKMKYMVTHGSTKIKDIVDPSAIFDTEEEAMKCAEEWLDSDDMDEWLNDEDKNFGAIAIVKAPEGIRAVRNREEYQALIQGKGYPKEGRNNG